MATSVRRIVLNQIRGYLEGITIAAGYATDLEGGRRIFEFGTIRLNSSPPAVFLVPGPEQVAEPANDRLWVDMMLTVAFVVRSGGGSSRDGVDAAEALMADIQLALGRDGRGRLVTFSAPKFPTGDVDSWSAWWQESGSIITSGEELGGLVVGQVDYSVHYPRHTHTPFMV